MTIQTALDFGRKILKKAGIEDPEASTEFLLKKSMRISRTDLYLKSDKVLTKKEEIQYLNWLDQRRKHKPVWYITGEIEFYGLDLLVDSNVLVPRPETELMIEEILKKTKGRTGLTALDVGTGSGAIILTLAKETPNGNFFASDISAEALSVSRKNAKKHNLTVDFRKGDLLAPWVDQKFDLVTANLPYVPHEDMASLAFDIIHHEPRVALDGGEGGVEVYRRFFNELPAVLNKRALVFCEIGNGQGDKLVDIVKKNINNVEIKVIKDYGQSDRIIYIKTL